MLNIALALIPARDDDGQAVFFAQPVAGPAYLVIAALVGMVVLILQQPQLPIIGSISHVVNANFHIRINQTSSLHEQFLATVLEPTVDISFYDILIRCFCLISQSHTNFRQTQGSTADFFFIIRFIVLRLKQIKQPFQSIAHFFFCKHLCILLISP